MEDDYFVEPVLLHYDRGHVGGVGYARQNALGHDKLLPDPDRTAQECQVDRRKEH